MSGPPSEWAAQCLAKIKENFIILCKAPSAIGNVEEYFGIYKTAIPEFLKKYPDHPKIVELYAEVRILRHPKDQHDERGFLYTQDVYRHLLRASPLGASPVGIVGPSFALGFSAAAPGPYTSFEWPRGGSLARYLQKLEKNEARDRRSVPAEFIWHVINSLLSTVKEIRGTYPLVSNEAAIVHRNINADTVLLEPYTNAFLTYPDVVLDYFDNAVVGPTTSHANRDISMIQQGTLSDLKAIGTLLHDLSHDKHLRNNHPRGWLWEELDEEGNCRCTTQSGVPAGAEFSRDDREYLDILRRFVMWPASFDVPSTFETLRFQICQRRSRSIENRMVVEQVYGYFNWDLALETIKVEDIKQALKDNQRET